MAVIMEKLDVQEFADFLLEREAMNMQLQHFYLTGYAEKTSLASLKMT